MPVAVARLRRAAAQLKAEDRKVTTTNLAEVMQVPYLSVLSTLKINGVKEEIGINDQAPEVPIESRYAAAATRLQEKDEPLTYKSLADELGQTRHAVATWLERHSEFCKSIPLVSVFKAEQIKRIRKYKTVVETLRQKKQRVTRGSIGREAKIDRTNVYRDFRLVPTLVDLLKESTVRGVS